MKFVLTKTLSRTFIELSTLLCLFSVGAPSWAQTERAVITHNSESITIAPIVYGIEKGFYRNEGINLEFRFLRSDLAAAAIAGGQDVDYMISAGTAFRAAVRGLPLKIVAYSFKQPLFYLLAQPSITSIKELKGKKIAVSSPQDTGGLAAKAAIQSAGLDPERDVTYVAIGAASVRLAAMEAGSVEAAIMPVPWNSRMKRKGFKELIFAGGLMPQPLTGIVASAAKLEKNPDQVKRVLRGYLRSLRALRQEKQDAVRFIGGRFSLDAETAEDVYKVVLQTMSEDGMMANSVLERYLDDVKKEPGAKKSVALSDIVDYRLLREVSRQMGS
jgi:ABC-type nitrate/sulfonate/bicarbonate transport system substrate-binding protein